MNDGMVILDNVYWFSSGLWCVEKDIARKIIYCPRNISYLYYFYFGKLERVNVYNVNLFRTTLSYEHWDSEFIKKNFYNEYQRNYFIKHIDDFIGYTPEEIYDYFDMDEFRRENIVMVRSKPILKIKNVVYTYNYYHYYFRESQLRCSSVSTYPFAKKEEVYGLIVFEDINYKNTPSTMIRQLNSLIGCCEEEVKEFFRIKERDQIKKSIANKKSKERQKQKNELYSQLPKEVRNLIVGIDKDIDVRPNDFAILVTCKSSSTFDERKRIVKSYGKTILKYVKEYMRISCNKNMPTDLGCYKVKFIICKIPAIEVLFSVKDELIPEES